MMAPNILENAASTGWKQLLSGDGGDVLDLQFGEAGDIVAVTRLGLFRSTNGGEAWARIESPPLVEALHRADDWWLGTDVGLFRAERPDGPWQAMVSGAAITGISAGKQDELVLISTAEEGLLRSEDGGNTWEDANAGLPGEAVVAIHRSPTFEQDRTIFVATESGIFRSRNGGRAWRQLPLEVEEVQCFVAVEDRLFVGTSDDGVWISSDFGRTWTQSLCEESILGFGLSTIGYTIVLCESGLVRVDKDGHPISRSPLPLDVLCALETGDGSFAGTAGRGVLRLMPETGKWNEATRGLQATARSRLRAIGRSRLITTSATGALMHSADDGASWHELPDTPLDAVIDFDARTTANGDLEVVACDEENVYVFREHWQQVEGDSPRAVAWLDDEGSMLTKDGEFIREKFRSRLFPWRVQITDARLMPLRGRSEIIWAVLYTENAEIIVVRSPDGGLRWEPLLQIDTAQAVSLAVTVDTSDNEVALFAEGSRIYSVLDSPTPKWTGDEATVISAIAVSPDDRVLLATNRGLLASSWDFSTVELVPGSPAPLLDVESDLEGNVNVIERGGSIWQFTRL